MEFRGHDLGFGHTENLFGWGIRVRNGGKWAHEHHDRQQYGAIRATRDGGLIDNRTLFVIDAEGRVAWRAVPFREVDPMAYVELGEALDRIAPVTEAAMQ